MAAYRPPMPPGPLRHILDTVDTLWRTIAALFVALLLGGNILLGAWAFKTAGHEGACMALIGGSFLATVAALAWHFAGDVQPDTPTTLRDKEQARDRRRLGRGGVPAAATATEERMPTAGGRHRRVRGAADQDVAP